MCNIPEVYSSKIEDFIKVCYKDVSSKQPTFKPVSNPINPEETSCILINNKKEQYYVHTYNPSNVLKNVETYATTSEFKTKYLHYMTELIDMEQRTNCCNCVSFTLYYRNDDDEDLQEYIDKLYGYLISIQLSVINIQNKLKDFLARIYLDISVLAFISKFTDYSSTIKNTDKILSIIRYLFSADNVEIYTYICPSYATNIEKTRMLRFLPMLDKEVNITISREADGIVSYTDIHNIKNFIKSNKMMFIYPFVQGNFLDNDFTNKLNKFKSSNDRTDIIKTKMLCDILAYSDGLKIYTDNKLNEYFTNKKQLFDILAGLFGVAIIIRNEKFYECMDIVNRKLSFMISKGLDEHILRRCFDEILLLELFKDLYTYKINCDYTYIKFEDYSNDDINNITLILNNFYYPLNKLEFNIKKPEIQNEIFSIISNGETSLMESYKIIYKKYIGDPPTDYHGNNISEIDILNMYIVDYNIDAIIDESNTNCIEVIVNENRISSILNYLITQETYSHYKLLLYIKNKSFDLQFGKVIENLYNNKYDFRIIISGLLDNASKQKYLKYKMKYIQLKNIVF